MKRTTNKPCLSKWDIMPQIALFLIFAHLVQLVCREWKSSFQNKKGPNLIFCSKNFNISLNFSWKTYCDLQMSAKICFKNGSLKPINVNDTHNMFIRPTKNFLFASEVRWFHQNCTFSRIFNLKIELLKSTRIKKWIAASVCRNKNGFTHRMITPFVSADS